MQTVESTAQINTKSVTGRCQALCGWAVGLFSPVGYWLGWNSPQGEFQKFVWLLFEFGGEWECVVNTGISVVMNIHLVHSPVLTRAGH